MTPSPRPTPFEKLLRPVARDSTVSEVARHLLDQLGASRVPPGTRLPSERVLSERLGVGRSTIREALSALDILGVIEIKPGSGSYLRGGTSEFLDQTINWGLMLGRPRTRDLVEVRQFLEIMSAGLAARRVRDANIARLGEHLAEMRRTVADPAAFVEADVAFHLEVAATAGNTVLTDLLASVRTLLRMWMEHAVGVEGTKAAAIDEHEAVLTAIRDRDEKAAEDAMRTHMDLAVSRLDHSLD